MIELSSHTHCFNLDNAFRSASSLFKSEAKMAGDASNIVKFLYKDNDNTSMEIRKKPVDE